MACRGVKHQMPAGFGHFGCLQKLDVLVEHPSSRSLLSQVEQGGTALESTSEYPWGDLVVLMPLCFSERETLRQNKQLMFLDNSNTMKKP